MDLHEWEIDEPEVDPLKVALFKRLAVLNPRDRRIIHRYIEVDNFEIIEEEFNFASLDAAQNTLRRITHVLETIDECSPESKQKIAEEQWRQDLRDHPEKLDGLAPKQRAYYEAYLGDMALYEIAAQANVKATAVAKSLAESRIKLEAASGA